MSGIDDIFDNMDKAAAAQPAQSAPVQSAAEAPTGYDAMFQNMDRATASIATQNVIEAQGSNPDKAAQALQLSKQNGVAQPAVEANLPQYQAQAELQKNVQTLNDNPNLASFVASNPLAARLASDDFDKLGMIEKTWDAIKTGVTSSLQSNALGRYGFQKQISTPFGIATPDVDQKIQQLGTALQKTPNMTGTYGAIQSAFGFGAGLIDNLITGGSAGAAGGALVGAALTPEAAGVGAAPGSVVGAGIGFKTDMSMVAAGNAYLKMGSMRGTDGQPLSEAGKQFGALFTGLATYALAGVGENAAGTAINQATDKLAQQALDQALTKPSFVQALTDYGISSAKGIAGGAALNTGMEATSILGEQLAQAVSPGQFDSNPQEIVDRLEHAAITGALTLGTMHMAMGGLGLYGDFRAAQHADQNAQMFKNLMDGSAESKLRARDMQAFQDFQQRQTDGTPVENLYIPADKIRELYQGARLDPGLADRTQDPLFGFVKDMPDQLREAQSTGGDVVIPTADYVAHLAGTPLSDKLMPDIRIGANSMSVNEAKTFNEQYQARLKAATDIAANQDDVVNPTQSIFNDVQKQALDAGRSKTEANQHAAIYASRYNSRAERLGVDPIEAYQKSGVEVLKGELGKNSKDGALMQQANGDRRGADRIRLDDIEKPVNEMSLDELKESYLRMRKNLGQSELTGLPTKSVWDAKSEEGKLGKYKASIDVDSLKWVNDNMGHEEGGNALLKHVGDSLSSAGIDAHHISGDEFYAHAETKEALEAGLQKARDELKSKEIEANGYRMKGMGFSYGIDQDVKKAENGLHEEKTAREAAGERSARGDTPPGVDRTSGESERGTNAQGTGIAPDDAQGTDERTGLPLNPDGTGKPGGSINVKIDSGRELNQPERGSIKLGDGKTIISLFKDADHSTLIHETGHLWLDELSKDAEIVGAPEQIKEDFNTVLKWLGADSAESITTEQHEQFARAVEAYFMEGKAPSQGLSRVFSRFKTWLTKIYQNVRNLNTPINDDIRGVMDRLLATDSEIEQARQTQGLIPAFLSKEQAGMTSAEWKSYTNAIDRANQQAESTMLDKTMAGIRRQRTAEYKDQIATIKERVAKSVDERADIKALTLVTKGMLDGEKIEGNTKLNRADIERTYGKEGVTDLPKGSTSPDGVDPDAVAEMLGYQSSEAMIKDLQSLEQQQREARLQDGERRGIRQILIDQQAEQEMQEKHGDIMDEQSMQSEAMAAIHSDAQTELLATELRYLKRMGVQALVERGQGRRAVKEYATKADWDAAEADLINQIRQAKTTAKIEQIQQKLDDLNMADRWNKAEANTTQAALREAVAVTKPMLDMIRSHAETILQGKTTDEIGNFNKYARDERKAAREVQDAILKKDWNAAADAKQRQILANVLYIKAKAESAIVDRESANMERLAAKPTSKSISQEYLNQIHDLIGLFGFDSKRGEELQRTKGRTLEKFVEDQSQERGIDLPVADWLYNTVGTPVSFMKLSEFKDLSMAVRGMSEVGKSDKIIEVDGEKREFTSVRDQLVAAIRALGERNKSEFLTPKNAGAGERLKEAMFHSFRSLDASLVKKESLFDQIDKNDPFGIANSAIFRKLKDGEHNRNMWSEQTAKEFKEAADSMPKDWLKRMRDVLPSDGSLRDPDRNQPAKMTRKDMIGIMLNWGNEGNRQRLTDGFGWDVRDTKAFLDRNATKDDWDFVQKIWNAYDKYKEPLDQLQQRVTGIGLDLVHADPFDTPHGKYDGGYYPIVEDKSRSYIAESHSEKSLDAMFPNGYTRATTQHGNTISRVGGKRPLSIDLDIAPWKIGQTIHDIAMREAIMDADRLLGDKEVKQAMDDVFGPEYRQLMRPWLQNIANSRNIDDASMSGWNRILQKTKTNTTIVGIGFRGMTMFKHGTTALSNSISELGPKWMLAGTKEMYANPMQTAKVWEFIKSKSPDMAYRLKHYDQDVGGQYANIFKDSALTKFQQQAQYFGHIGISYLDLGSAAPTWLGAYRKGLSEKMSDTDAVYFADKTVRNAHGAQGITDKSSFQEVKGPMSLFGMFYGFFNHIYNRQRSIAQQGAQGIANAKAGQYKQATSNFGSVLARSWYYVAVPALIEAMAQNGGPNTDQDETWSGWAAKAIMSEIPAGIPILRDIAKAAIEGRDYEMSPIAHAINTTIKAVGDVSDWMSTGEAPKDAGKRAVEGVGYASGLPTAAPFTAGKFLWDYTNGDVDPQNLSDWIQGLLKGKLKQ